MYPRHGATPHPCRWHIFTHYLYPSAKQKRGIGIPELDLQRSTQIMGITYIITYIYIQIYVPWYVTLVGLSHIGE